MIASLDALQKQALADIKTASSLDALESVRVAVLGKKGSLTEALKTLGQLSPEERKAHGQQLNQIKQALEAAIEEKRKNLNDIFIAAKLAHETSDVTLPIRPEKNGKVHPITQVMEEVVAIFSDMGFAVAEGPIIEDEKHNFDALNIPASHPARQMHDTFYLNGKKDGEHLLLRTHTSPVQIHAMHNNKPPMRFIAPGSTYRCDSDMTHTPMFHQLEGFAIGKDVHMGQLKGCLQSFVQAFFEVENVPVRFRPSFFPFTEPSAEMDIGCSHKGGELKIGDYGDWLEILGCGMIHPNVLKNCGIDPVEWQGFAFGLGLDRIAMLKYGIPDLRTFFEPDVRWLSHYGFDAMDIPSLVTGLTR